MDSKHFVMAVVIPQRIFVLLSCRTDVGPGMVRSLPPSIPNLKISMVALPIVRCLTMICTSPKNASTKFSVLVMIPPFLLKSHWHRFNMDRLVMAIFFMTGTVLVRFQNPVESLPLPRR